MSDEENDATSWWAAEEAAWAQADSALTPGIWLDAALEDHAWHAVEIESNLMPDGKHRAIVPRNADLVRRLRIDMDMVHDTPIIDWVIGGNIVGHRAAFTHATIPLGLIAYHEVQVMTTVPFVLRYEAAVASATARARATALIEAYTRFIVSSVAGAEDEVAVAGDMPRPPLRVRHGCVYSSAEMIRYLNWEYDQTYAQH